MTSWRSNTNLLFLLALLIIIDHSKEDCQHYIQFDFLRRQTVDIPLIKTKDPKDQFECSLNRICQDKNEFCYIWDHCFTEGNVTLPKCAGERGKNVSFYLFMCKLASEIKLPSHACKGFDAVFQSSPTELSAILDPTTTTTTTPERTTTSLQPNATSVQPTPTTNATSTSATSTSATSTNATSTSATSTNATSTNATSTSAAGSCMGYISNNNSTAAGQSGEVSSYWRTAFLLSVIVCTGLVALCLYTWRRHSQLLETIKGLRKMRELQPDANGNESTILMQCETPINDAPVSNDSLH